MKLKLIPEKTSVPFLKHRLKTFILSGLLIILSAVMFFGPGLNKGIDFEGGIMIEVGFKEAPDLSDMRSSLGGLGLGQVSLQTFGAPDDILIRVQRQDGAMTPRKKPLRLSKHSLKKITARIAFPIAGLNLLDQPFLKNW
nr:hypothetical protein [Sneathiella glossodoripedis]